MTELDTVRHGVLPEPTGPEFDAAEGIADYGGLEVTRRPAARSVPRRRSRGAEPQGQEELRAEPERRARSDGRRLAPHYKKARIAPRPDGSGLEFTIGAKIDSKKTDVSVWDDAAGLILGVSIKTYSFRDFHGATKKKAAHLGRYVRNVKRNDLELRDEADVLHRRQPYAVLFALFFMPKDACWDGIAGHSSFAHAVFTFRKRTGRDAADAVRSDLFEKVFIGLFSDEGSVEFFDVQRPPPKNQPPLETISLADLIEVMRRDVVLRNEGVAPEERYAFDDPTWRIPEDSLPKGIDAEEPLDYADAITDADGAREDDDVESE